MPPFPPTVERLLSLISFSEEDREKANVRLGIVGPQGQFYIPSSTGRLAGFNWGWVSLVDDFVDAVAECLQAGFRVAVDSRCDKAEEGRTLMLIGDLDKIKGAPPTAFPVSIDDLMAHVFRVLLESSHLSRQQKYHAYLLQATVTQNRKKQESFHLYFHNLFCVSFKHFQTVINSVAETLNPLLAPLGYKWDPAIASMGSLRWPMTYSFNSRHSDGDDRHMVIGVFQPTNTTNDPLTWGVKKFDPWTRPAQDHSPLGGIFSGDPINPFLHDGVRNLMRVLLPWGIVVGNEHTTLMQTGPFKKRSLEEKKVSEPKAGKPDLPVFDMRNKDVYFDIQEARELLYPEPSREFKEYMCERVCMVNCRFFVKLVGGRSREFTIRDLTKGPMMMTFQEEKERVDARGNIKVTSKTICAWQWFADISRARHYHAAEILPFSPLDTELLSDDTLILNLWTGFAVHEHFANLDRIDFNACFVRDDDFNFFMYHLHSVLLDNSANCLYRLLCWLRHIVISPQRTVGKIIVLEGPGGVGKTALVEFLHKYFFGCAHSVLLPNTEGITSRFNGVTANAVVAFIDEGGVGDQKSFNTLKQVTTTDKRQTERKFHEPESTAAPLNVFFSVNAIDNPLSSHERRYDVFRTNPDVHMECGKPELLAQCYRFGALCRDPQKAARLAIQLVALVVRFVDYSAYETQKNTPFMTPGYVKMRKEGMSGPQRFWSECIEHVCNHDREPIYDEDEAKKPQVQGNWGTYIPYSWVERRWRNWRSCNYARVSRNATFLDSLSSFGCTTKEQKGVLWLKVPEHKEAKKKFRELCASAAEESELKVQKLKNQNDWLQFPFFKKPSPDEQMQEEEEDSSQPVASQSYWASDDSDSDDSVLGCASDSGDDGNYWRL